MEAVEYEALYQQEWYRVSHRFQHRFARGEMYQRAQHYVQALMQPLGRRNGWQVAEQLGDRTPDGVQRLLNSARWDSDGLRDDVRQYAVEVLGAEEAILVVDETGFLKKGTKSVGVKRQYSGTAGRIENCQIGVFLTYATPKGHSLIDRALYLPQEWATDRERRGEAKVPTEVEFQTKPRLAQGMLADAFAAGVVASWVTGDSIYGGDRRLRLWLEERQQPFVLAVNSNEPLWRQLEQVRADVLAETLPEQAWQRLSVGDGAKGPRLYDWATVALPRWGQDPTWQHALLIRRSLHDVQEVAYFVVFAPANTALQDWAHVAGQRWTVEECFEHAKSELGLDEYEVRHWHGWYRHVTLVLLAQAFLQAMRLQAQHVEKNSARFA
jgi:SRSO17 transposase